MNKKFLKRVAAFAMAATLVLGNAAVVLADTATGNGSNEGPKPDYPVASITLPTVTNEKMFDYIVDPQGLIEATKDAGSDYQHYDYTSDFKAGASMWFQQFASPAVSGLKKFEPTSDSLSIENKSAVDITITATAVGDASYTGAVKFVTGSTFTSGAKEIYIAAQGKKADITNKTTLGSESDVAAVPIKGLGAANGAKLTFDLKGNADAYSLIYNKSTSKYEYKFSTDSSLKFSKGSFQLTGACNNAEQGKAWGNDTCPKLTVTWSWAKKIDISNLGLTKNTSNGNLFYEFSAGTAPSGSLTAVTINGQSGATPLANGNVVYDPEYTKFYIKAVTVTNFNMTQGNTTVVATIGGTDYTFKY